MGNPRPWFVQSLISARDQYEVSGSLVEIIRNPLDGLRSLCTILCESAWARASETGRNNLVTWATAAVVRPSCTSCSGGSPLAFPSPCWWLPGVRGRPQQRGCGGPHISLDVCPVHGACPDRFLLLVLLVGHFESDHEREAHMHGEVSWSHLACA